MPGPHIGSIGLTRNNGPRGGAHLLKTLPSRQLSEAEINAPPEDSDEEAIGEESKETTELAPEKTEAREGPRRPRSRGKRGRVLVPTNKWNHAAAPSKAPTIGSKESGDLSNDEDGVRETSEEAATVPKVSPKRPRGETEAKDEEGDVFFAISKRPAKKTLRYASAHDRNAAMQLRDEKTEKGNKRPVRESKKTFQAPKSQYHARLEESVQNFHKSRPKFQVPSARSVSLASSPLESEADVGLPASEDVESAGQSDFSLLPISSSQDTGKKKFLKPRQLPAVPRTSGSVAQKGPSTHIGPPEDVRVTGDFLKNVTKVLSESDPYKVNQLGKDFDMHDLSGQELTGHTAGDGSLSSALTSPPDSPDSFKGESDSENDDMKMVRCPMCKEHIPAEIYRAFDNGTQRMKVRTQAKVCRAHRQRPAQQIWSARGYPELDWDNFGQRIKRYYPVLDSMLDSKTPSFYRKALAAKVSGGKNRTLAQSMMGAGIDGLTPGYYGSKGARMMLEGIIHEFSDKIRLLAPTDKLIASGGVAGYVQSVLVPELAILLIKEDMNVGEQRARSILEESVEIGDLLNEEDDEVVQLPQKRTSEVVELREDA